MPSEPTFGRRPTTPRAVVPGARPGGPPGPIVLAVLVLASVSGCQRQPQISTVNRDLITSLATAVSARDPDWLEKNARRMERQKAEGVLSQVEYETFARIIAQARSGDWQAAESAVYALRDGQEPTAEDQQRAAERHLEPQHKMPVRPKGRR